jgi:hypothetical protein
VADSSSVSISESKSVTFCYSWADASRVNDSAQRRDVCKYSYPTGKWIIWEYSTLEVLPVGVGGNPGRAGVPSVVECGVGCLRRLGGDTPVTFCLQCVCGFFAVPCWQGRHPAVWFWWHIAGCFSITAFTWLCPAKSTVHLFSARTSARGLLICYSFFSIAAREYPPLALLPILKARRMSVYSSCTRYPCLAIVGHILNTYKKSVVASNNEMRRLPQP